MWFIQPSLQFYGIICFFKSIRIGHRGGLNSGYLLIPLHSSLLYLLCYLARLNFSICVEQITSLKNNKNRVSHFIFWIKALNASLIASLEKLTDLNTRQSHNKQPSMNNGSSFSLCPIMFRLSKPKYLIHLFLKIHLNESTESWYKRRLLRSIQDEWRLDYSK